MVNLSSRIFCARIGPMSGTIRRLERLANGVSSLVSASCRRSVDGFLRGSREANYLKILNMDWWRRGETNSQTLLPGNAIPVSTLPQICMGILCRKVKRNLDLNPLSGRCTLVLVIINHFMIIPQPLGITSNAQSYCSTLWEHVRKNLRRVTRNDKHSHKFPQRSHPELAPSHSNNRLTLLSRYIFGPFVAEVYLLTMSCRCLGTAARS